MEWTVSQLAYLAGIIDGEGCVNIYSGGTRGRRDINVRFYVVSTDYVLIEWLLTNFSGLSYTITTREGWKTKYQWVVERKLFDEISQAILPYLVIKKPQVELALKFRSSYKIRYRKLPDDVVKFREDCFHQMRLLNNRNSTK